MVHTTHKVRRHLAVLSLPKSISALLVYAAGVVKAMTGNPTFPSPTPALATVSAAIVDLQDAEVAAMDRRRGAATARDARRRTLVATLQLLCIYVQSVADQSAGSGPAIILSAGMRVKRIAPRRPRVFVARAGAVPGTVKIAAPQAAPRASYDWQYATDGATWVSLPSTLQARTTMTDQSAGTLLHLRYRAVTRMGQASWSAPITFLVRES
jgi:hypothetical protein